ncbi:MAG: hypothetical protein ABSB80_09725 [Methanoregula sp.]|uniref:hypothetical protein n=1 Tax=Methanoregula sp. TaxID=2052170 RepID=UPI003D0B7884
MFSADERIRKTIISLMYRPGVPQDIRNSALYLFIASRPNNLNEELQKIFNSLNTDDPLLTVGLETLASLHYIQALDSVKSVIRTTRTRGGKADYGVKALEKFGHSDAATELVSFMDGADNELQKSSRESLFRSGYSENVRYIETGRLIKTLYHLLTEIKEDIIKGENQLREVNFKICIEECAYRHMEYTTNRYFLDREISYSEMNTSLMSEEEQKIIQKIGLDAIFNAARSFEPELQGSLRQYTNRDDADQMYATLYSEILSQNNHLEEALKTPQDTMKKITAEIQEIQKNHPSPPASDAPDREKMVKDYESELKEREYTMDILNKEFQTYASEMKTWETRVNHVSSDIRMVMNRVRVDRVHSYLPPVNNTETAIHEIQQGILRIDSIEYRQRDLRNRIQKAIDEANHTMQSLRNQTKKHRDRIVELAAQRATIKKDIEDSHIASQKLQQSLNEEKKNLDLLQTRRERQNSISDNIARQRAEFWSDKKRLEDEAKRYLECTVERVVEEKFNPEYQETLEFFRKRLEKSGLK